MPLPEREGEVVEEGVPYFAPPPPVLLPPPPPPPPWLLGVWRGEREALGEGVAVGDTEGERLVELHLDTAAHREGVRDERRQPLPPIVWEGVAVVQGEREEDQNTMLRLIVGLWALRGWQRGTGRLRVRVSRNSHLHLPYPPLEQGVPLGEEVTPLEALSPPTPAVVLVLAEVLGVGVESGG